MNNNKVTKQDLKKYLIQEGCGKNSCIVADKVVSWIVENIKLNRTIEVRGFGTFYTVEIPAHKNRFNPEKIVPARLKVKFRPGKQLQG